MKNIHIIPTTKSNKLYKNLLTDKLFILENSFMDVSECNREYQNIYITSDEEIKEGDYGLIVNEVLSYSQMHKKWGIPQGKKIILTTDQDLIKDGVQPIDDEFLEWFVNNPSCESVEIEELCGGCGSNDGDCWRSKECNKGYYKNKYKIIISKKEPKQDINTCKNFDREIGCDLADCLCEKEEPTQELAKTEIDWSGFPKSTQEQVGFTEPNIIDEWLDKNGSPEIAKQVDEEAKELCEQETLEEALERLSLTDTKKLSIFLDGMRYQQERSYSEEEVKIMYRSLWTPKDFGFYSSYEMESNFEDDFNLWFEQFKKK